MRPKVEMPTPEDDAAIQAGIEADPNTFEVTDEQFARMRPAADVMPYLVRRRGAQKAPTKVPVALRLDADLVKRLPATGKGWQTTASALLRTALDATTIPKP